MRSLSLGGCALSISAAVAFLAGCSAARPPIGAPGAMPQSVHAATSSYAVLYRFDGEANGGRPLGRLLDVDRTLYGTASQGGTRPCSHGCGTVYSISPKGVFSVLFSFGAGNGAQPNSDLIDVKGTLYGTTPKGGASQRGTVYSITTAGIETTLYSFKGRSDGMSPNGRLINVTGTLYGTTPLGGTQPCIAYYPGCGVVYSISTSGQEKVLHRFTGVSDGIHPNALVYIKGMLYGTTATGGTGKGCLFVTVNVGCGTFYSLSPSGKHRVLYSFGGGSDGEYPQGELTQVNGTLYGTTTNGGFGYGTVYSITTSGVEQVVYRFAGSPDGAAPVGGLLDLNGTLYGTTHAGGVTECVQKTPRGCGTIYSVTTSGAENVLYRFTGDRQGFNPMTALTDLHGSLYGTTFDGGKKICCGTIFRFTP
jgi:uncharacterized repeat protein (TIGR03803 family)